MSVNIFGKYEDLPPPHLRGCFQLLLKLFLNFSQNQVIISLSLKRKRSQSSPILSLPLCTIHASRELCRAFNIIVLLLVCKRSVLSVGTVHTLRHIVCENFPFLMYNMLL